MNTSSGLLIPHMIGQVVAVCLMTIIGSLALLVTFTGVKLDPSLGSDFGSVFLAIGVLCLAMALAEVWFFFLIRDAYIHFKRKEVSETPLPPIPPVQHICSAQVRLHSMHCYSSAHIDLPSSKEENTYSKSLIHVEQKMSQYLFSNHQDAQLVTSECGHSIVKKILLKRMMKQSSTSQKR